MPKNSLSIFISVFFSFIANAQSSPLIVPDTRDVVPLPAGYSLNVMVQFNREQPSDSHLQFILTGWD
ncbi:hypothetical protein [Sphingobacterium mizutaii]|uniref:hypothetical protein n=1 Tax=Sphingobacterium mizutaii TaxID=1010 RepID=UPI001BE3FFA6|nr:hypothetical protein [Sphingobacterium mizutaii]